MSNIFYLPRVHSLPGAKLYFRVSGTSTPQNTYTNIDLTVPSSNPLVADSEGYFDTIYLDPSLPNYRVIHTDGSDPGNDPTLEVQLEPTQDDYPSSSNVSSTYRVKGTNPNIIFEETDASTNNKKWRISVNAETLTIDAGNDAESSWTPMLSIGRTGSILTSGSFAATLTGMSSGGTGTIYWQKVGNIVTLRAGVSGISGTSNDVFMSLTGMPATLRPANIALMPLGRILNNSATAMADGFVQASGEVQFSKWTSFTATSLTGFTNSGDKGLPSGWSTTYSLD